jgi:hypothetical protein
MRGAVLPNAQALLDPTAFMAMPERIVVGHHGLARSPVDLGAVRLAEYLARYCSI